MKKIMLIAITLVFALTLGVAYADEGGKMLNNSATDFTGRTYDSLVPAFPAVIHGSSVQGSGAGSFRTEDPAAELNNGITDLSGRTYDTIEANPVTSKTQVIEGSAAGGLRENLAGKESSVRNYDLELPH